MPIFTKISFVALLFGCFFEKFICKVFYFFNRFQEKYLRVVPESKVFDAIQKEHADSLTHSGVLYTFNKVLMNNNYIYIICMHSGFVSLNIFTYHLFLVRYIHFIEGR